MNEQSNRTRHLRQSLLLKDAQEEIRAAPSEIDLVGEKEKELISDDTAQNKFDVLNQKSRLSTNMLLFRHIRLETLLDNATQLSSPPPARH